MTQHRNKIKMQYEMNKMEALGRHKAGHYGSYLKDAKYIDRDSVHRN